MALSKNKITIIATCLILSIIAIILLFFYLQQRQNNSHYVKATIMANQHIVLAPVSGTLVEITKQKGQKVKQYETIIALTNPSYTKDLELAEAKRESLDIVRKKNLIKQGKYDQVFYGDLLDYLSQDWSDYPLLYLLLPKPSPKLDKMTEEYRKMLDKRRDMEIFYESELTRKHLELADVEIKIAKYFADSSKIIAPFEGIIDEIMVTPNQIVTSGMPLLSMHEEKYYLLAYLTEKQMLGINYASKFDIILPNRPETILHGAVNSISPAPIENPQNLGIKDFDDKTNYYGVQFILLDQQDTTQNIQDILKLNMVVDVRFYDDNTVSDTSQNK